MLYISNNFATFKEIKTYLYLPLTKFHYCIMNLKINKVLWYLYNNKPENRVLVHYKKNYIFCKLTVIFISTYVRDLFNNKVIVLNTFVVIAELFTYHRVGELVLNVALSCFLLIIFAAL